MSDIFALLSMGMLLTTFILVANKRTMSYIRTFRIQALLLAAVLMAEGVTLTAENHVFSGVMLLAVLTVIVKAWYIPRNLSKISRRAEQHVEKEFFVNVPMALLISTGILVLVGLVLSRVEGLKDSADILYMTCSLGVMLMGMFFMVNRKRAVGQMTGFLVMENGLFLAAFLMTHGMPMMVEIGLLLDLVTSVVVMGSLAYRIHDTFESLNMDRLRRLRG